MDNPQSKILQNLAAGHSVMLHGPRGSGKCLLARSLGFELISAYDLECSVVPYAGKLAAIDVLETVSLNECLTQKIKLITTPLQSIKSMRGKFKHMEIFPNVIPDSCGEAPETILSCARTPLEICPLNPMLNDVMLQSGCCSPILLMRFLKQLALNVGTPLELRLVAVKSGLHLKVAARILRALENSYVIYFARSAKQNHHSPHIGSHYLLFWDTSLLLSLLQIADREQLTTHSMKAEVLRNLAAAELYKRARQERPFCRMYMRYSGPSPLFSFEGSRCWYHIDDTPNCIEPVAGNANIRFISNEALLSWIPASQQTSLQYYTDREEGCSAPTVTILNGTVRIFSDSKHTQGRQTLTVQMFAEGEGPPLHTHPMDETLYVLEGMIEVYTLTDGQLKTFKLMPGDSLFVPSMMVHTFKAVGSPKNSLIASFSPSGNSEQFFLNTGEPQAGKFRLPDHPKTTPEAIQNVLDSMSKHHFTIWQQDCQS